MAPLFPDRRRSLLALALVVAALGGSQQLAHTAAISSRGSIQVNGNNWNANLSAGTLSLRSVRLTQAGGTLIEAEEGSATGIDGGFENSQWELRGKVHVEFDGAVLDAEAAAVSFAAGRLESVQVQGKGTPAQFSHTARQDGQRREGRAANIDYQTGSGQVHFSNGTWFFDGRNEFTAGQLFYNVNTTVLADDGNPATVETLTRRPREERVPPPRPPAPESAR